MLFLTIFLIIIGLYFIFFISQFINIAFRGYAPLITTDQETIQAIINELNINDQSVVYELGCGQAVFLQSIETSFPQTKLIGIENLTTVYLFNYIRLKLRKSRISLIKNDIFKASLTDADFIYCYLNNDTMKRLGDKIAEECRNGTIIISRHFPIPQFQPYKTIEIKSKKVYFYKIGNLGPSYNPVG
jgi:hypothetical protein